MQRRTSSGKELSIHKLNMGLVRCLNFCVLVQIRFYSYLFFRFFFFGSNAVSNLNFLDVLFLKS